jgi:CO/xanthine dehydrogenase Mo-binding subunit
MLTNRRYSFDASVPQTYLHARIGFDDDGIIKAVQGHNVHQSGIRSGYSDKTAGHLVLPPQLTGFRITKCENIYCEMEQMLTNGTAATADPGQNQFEPVNMAFGVVADKLKMDITDVIMNNIHTTAPSLEACMAAGKAAIKWNEKWHLPGQGKMPDGRLHGMACRVSNSQTWGMINYNVNISLRPDGKVYMPYTEGLIGTYWPDAVRMVIAEELGLKIEDVYVYYAPHFVNWQQGDAADRGSTCTWAAKEAANLLREKILKAAASRFPGSTPDDLTIIDSVIQLKSGGTTTIPISQLGGQHAADFVGKPSVAYDSTMKIVRTMNADFCEVAIDPQTGLVEILDYVSAHDFGKVIRPSSATGQQEQALTMASSRALREELIWDQNTGVMLNGNLIDYKPPTALDQPPITTIPIETRCGGGAYGSTGVAHAHCSATLVSLAIQNAIGTFITQEPFTPAKVLAALGKIEGV